MKVQLFEHLQLIFFFGLLGLLTNGIAYSKGFFSLHQQEEKKTKSLLAFKQVFFAFLIYLGTTFLIAPLLAQAIALGMSELEMRSNPPLFALSFLQLAILGCILFLLTVFALRQDRPLMKAIWKDSSFPGAKPIYQDFLLGAATWLLGFPVVAVVGELGDLLIFWLFQVESYEQVAVRYLKMSLGSTLLLPVALITILVLAPVIEEWLFRGFLQTWLKKNLGTKAAILVSSLAFALFHLSSSQGMGNIPLAASLFTFACYLGFLYEKQRSLFAPIGLHMAFNAISSLRILLS